MTIMRGIIAIMGLSLGFDPRPVQLLRGFNVSLNRMFFIVSS